MDQYCLWKNSLPSTWKMRQVFNWSLWLVLQPCFVCLVFKPVLSGSYVSSINSALWCARQILSAVEDSDILHPVSSSVFYLVLTLSTVTKLGKGEREVDRKNSEEHGAGQGWGARGWEIETIEERDNNNNKQPRTKTGASSNIHH